MGSTAIQKSSDVEPSALAEPWRAEIAGLAQRVEELVRENAELRAEIAKLRGKNPTQRLDQSYSLKAEERRQREDASKSDSESSSQARDAARKHGSHAGRQVSKRRGRLPDQNKIDRADEHEVVLPEGFDLMQCEPGVERPVWRIRDGKATLVVYEIWRGPNGEVGSPEGVRGQSQFGQEIVTTVAFLVSMVGLSIDKVCELLRYFWQLELSKSQADALLNQLSRAWEPEFESLCLLLAVSAVVHADETSWSLNSVWAFLSEKARVLVYGCHKDGDTLAQILPKESFAGILVSDDAAVYQGFSKAQKCWAHLLRKAIRFTLLKPDNEEYRTFLNGLLDVFRAGKQAAADQRLKDVGRASRVSELIDQLSAFCVERSNQHDAGAPALDDIDHDFTNLVLEVARLMCDSELFTFVRHPEADATNNEAERSLRSAAMDRRTGRTSKTLRGAQRKTILVSVLESIKLHLPKFTLSAVQAELTTWWQRGTSRFDEMLKSCGLDPPTDSRLNKLVPLPNSA